MLERARLYSLPLFLTLWGLALLAQNFLLLPNEWRLLPFAVIFLGIYLLLGWDRATTAPGQRFFRIPRAETLSASLVIDSGPVAVQLATMTDKAPTGAGREAANMMTGQYATTSPTVHRHFQHATLLLDRRPFSLFDWGDWRLNLAPDIPWQLEIRSWLGELKLDCGALSIESASCSSVFGPLHFSPPTRASEPLSLRNALGDIHVHIPADRSCRVRIHRSRFTRVHRDERRYVIREDGSFAAGSLAESVTPTQLELYPGLGDVYLE